MTKKIKLVAVPHKREPLETHMRYDVYFDGSLFDTLYYNLTGYVGFLPTPEGKKLSIGERSLTAYRKEMTRLNREFEQQGISV